MKDKAGMRKKVTARATTGTVKPQGGRSQKGSNRVQQAATTTTRATPRGGLRQKRMLARKR